MATRRFHRVSILFALVVLTTGCAHVISPEVRETAREDLTLAMVLQNPSAYLGETVVWGGIILNTLDQRDGTVITVLETPLNIRGQPIEAQPRGRFIGKSSEYLDREIYQTGRNITLAGEIIGYEGKPPGEISPVVSIKESRSWKISGEKREYWSSYDRPRGYWWWW